MPVFDLTDSAESGLGETDPFVILLNELSAPSDASGHYGDATVPSGLSAPTFLQESIPFAKTLSGRGRIFAEGLAYQFQCLTIDDPNGTIGDIGVAAVVWWDMAAQQAYGQDGAILSQGTVTYPWLVKLQVIDSAARVGRLVMTWTVSGVEVVIPGGDFIVPTTPFLVCASREKTAVGFVVRLFAAGESLGTYVEPSFSVDLVANERTYLGARFGGVQHFHGVIDSAHVVLRPITHEEAELLQWRLANAGHEGYSAIRGMSPRGRTFSRDESTQYQRELQSEGAGLALAKATFRRVQRYFVPTKAWGSALRYWEKALRIPPRPGDGVSDRRTRVAAKMRGVTGFAASDIQSVLAESLGYEANPALAQIIEYDDEWADDMTPLVTSSGLYVSGHPTHAWEPRPNTHTSFTEPAGGNAYLQSTAGGTDDLRYSGWMGQSTPERNAPMYIRYVGCGTDRNFQRGTGGKQMWARGEIRAITLLPNLVLLAGVIVGSVIDDEWIWAGLRANGANFDLIACKYVDGSLDLAFTVLASNVGSAPRFIEVRHKGNGRDNLGTYGVRQAATAGGLPGATEFDVTGGPTDPSWAGYGCTASRADATVGAHSVRFGAWWQRHPNSPAHTHWAVLRNPAHPGAYDLPRANAILKARGPAYADGTVIDRQDGLSTSNASTILDRDPLEH